MDGYDKNSKEGKMSLEDVLELYNGQEDGETTGGSNSYKDISFGNIAGETYTETKDLGQDSFMPATKNLQEHVPSRLYKERKRAPARRRGASFAEASSWFQTICWLNIPVLGFLYMFVLLIRKTTPRHKKNFIIGYIMYKLLVWILAIVFVYWLYKTGLDFIDGMLKYVT